MKIPPVPAGVVDAIDARTVATAMDAPRRRIRSADLFGDSRKILIEHAGELYLLTETRKGKLILTK